MNEKSVSLLKRLIKKLTFSTLFMGISLITAYICSLFPMALPLELVFVVLIPLVLTFALFYTYATHNRCITKQEIMHRYLYNFLFIIMFTSILLFLQRRIVEILQFPFSIALSYVLTSFVSALIYMLYKRFHATANQCIKKCVKSIKTRTIGKRVKNSNPLSTASSNGQSRSKVLQWIATIAIPTLIFPYILLRAELGNRIVNPFVQGEQISAISKERDYKATDSKELLNTFLAQKEFDEIHNIAVQQQKCEDETQFRIIVSERYRETKRMSPVSDEFISRIGRVYYLGGYFRIFLTNPYDYDLIATSFLVNASNIVVDQSSFLDAYPFVTENTASIIITNSGWGSATDIEITLEDTCDALTSIWSNDSLKLVIPEIAPGEKKQIVLLSTENISEQLFSELRDNPATIYADINSKDNSSVLYPMKIDVSTNDYGFISHGIGQTATLGPRTYGIIVNTSESHFESLYSSRDLINANSIGEFLLYLASDKSCTMSLKFTFGFSDGNRMESIKYDNIRIRVPFYEGEGAIGDGNAVKNTTIDKSEVELLYPFIKP